jgi:hypothetical protein
MTSVALLLSLLAASEESGAALARPTVIVVVGAAGSADYGAAFGEWAGRWEQASRKAQAEFHLVGREPAGAASDRERLRELLDREAKTGERELWLVLIGHGTFAGETAKFNLRGPDIAASELAAWLQGMRRPFALINCTSASGPFLSALSGPERVVIAATRSGHELNYARFGDFLSQAILSPAADLDKDGQTSLLEAYLRAARQVEEFYKLEGRLATEHALLDDNGDRHGTPPDWFQGVRPTRKAEGDAALDGYRAHQWHLVRSRHEQTLPPAIRQQRDKLELAVVRLREQKPQFAEDDYYERLEGLLIELARLSGETDSEQD